MSNKRCSRLLTTGVLTMKTKIIALLAIPALIAISTFSLAQSDQEQSGWNKNHSADGQYKNHHGVLNRITLR